MSENERAKTVEPATLNPYWHGPVWDWFELSYAQYLTIPRSIMCSMPREWQERMVQCLEELDEAFEWRPKEGRYWVQLKDDRGRYTHDPLMQYRHPDREYIESIRKEPYYCCDFNRENPTVNHYHCPNCWERVNMPLDHHVYGRGYGCERKEKPQNEL